MEQNTLFTLTRLLKDVNKGNLQTELLNLGLVKLDAFLSKVEAYYHLPAPLNFSYDVATLGKLSLYIDTHKPTI